MLKKPAGGGVLSPDVAVRGMLRDLGRDGRTYGKWRHALSGFGASIAPLSLLHGVILRKVQAMHKRQVEKGYAEMYE